jgi:hypothetical protein
LISFVPIRMLQGQNKNYLKISTQLSINESITNINTLNNFLIYYKG